MQSFFLPLTVGFVGFGTIDTNNIGGLFNASTNYNPREKNIALGGQLGYDFGRFSVNGFVTRSLQQNAIIPAKSIGADTRGWLRVVVPLYIAPPPSAVVAATEAT